MPKIRILPDRVANQIAAGEVVERPAAVIKELVENALDAGATRLEVEFSHGGRALMRVEDNGAGMSREDALLALERHATSKIAEAGDLDRLASFGFRGEALPSIASVSRFLLQTAEEGGAGTEILVNGGRLAHVRDCGRPRGTRIEVTQLFNSVPARRKFLKSDATEAAHIVTAVRLHALAAPHCAVTLIEDGRVVFRSPTCPALADRVAEIFGRQIAEGLMPIDAREGGLRLHGLIARPGSPGQATRHATITFVNRRPVDSRTLAYGLIESYHEVLPKGRHPAAFVFLELDPAAVDVNVHPAKREVRFRDDAKVRGFVIRSVLGRLREHSGGVAGPVGGDSAPTATVEVARVDAGRSGWSRLETSASVVPAEHGRAVVPLARPQPVALAPSVDRVVSVGKGAVEVKKTEADVSGAGFASWRYLGLAHSIYAVFETPAGVVLLDRRAAQERIYFEELSAQFERGVVTVQRLLLPPLLELDPVGSALLRDRREFLNKHGFELAEFGRHAFRLEGVPAVMDPADGEACLRDLLDTFRDGFAGDRDPQVARDKLARLAAARAVRLPSHPDVTDMRALLARLFSCGSPHTNPSGRPTLVELSRGELGRRFGRS